MKHPVVIAVCCLAAAAPAFADILDFEDLPFMVGMPNGWNSPTRDEFGGVYHGLNFTAVNAAPQPAGYENTWFYYQLNTAAQDPPYNPGLSGAWWGISSGEFALGSGQDTNNTSDPPGYWQIARADGGLFRFDGAMFTAHEPYANGIRFEGYVGGAQLLNEVHVIQHNGPTFAAPNQELFIDRLVLRGVGPWNNYQFDRGFVMDDFQFTAAPGVPAPAVGTLLALSGLGIRVRRRRD